MKLENMKEGDVLSTPNGGLVAHLDGGDIVVQDSEGDEVGTSVWMLGYTEWEILTPVAEPVYAVEVMPRGSGWPDWYTVYMTSKGHRISCPNLYSFNVLTGEVDKHGCANRTAMDALGIKYNKSREIHGNPSIGVIFS